MAVSAGRRYPSPETQPRTPGRCRRPWAEYRASSRSAVSLVASQDSFAIHESLAARHVARIVAVAVELELQQRGLRGFAGEMLDIRIGPALEVGNIDHVQIGMLRRDARGSQNFAARRPEHVRMQVADGFAAAGQKVERYDIGSIAMPQL